MCVCKDEAAVCLVSTLWHVSAVSCPPTPPTFPLGGFKLDYYQGASPLSSTRPGPPCCCQQMPPSRDPHNKEPAVSQVLLILIGSGMTYCRGEGDCHGPTGMGAGGIQGYRRGSVCVFVCVFPQQKKEQV